MRSLLSADSINLKHISPVFMVGELKEAHQQLKYLKANALVGVFDGVNTALNFVKDYYPKPANKGESSSTGDGWFNFFPNYKTALYTYLNNPMSIVEFDETQLAIRDVNESGNEVAFDITGDFIDIGRHLEGIPESFGSLYNGQARNRRITIFLNLNYGGSFYRSDINRRSERVVRLVDALEASGVRTEVTGIWSNETVHVEVGLKRHEEPLTISDLAVVTHSDFLRRILFRISEHSKTWQSGYGSSVIFSQAIHPKLIEPENINEIAIFVDSNFHDIDSDLTFDHVEKLLSWELSKPIPEISTMIIRPNRVQFSGNGARDEDEIQEEGNRVANEE